MSNVFSTILCWNLNKFVLYQYVVTNQHIVNSLFNKLSSPVSNGHSNIVISDTNHMNTSLISVFSGVIFTQGTAVSRETGHALQCKVCKKIV
jgi:hypothetical protein